MVPQLSLLDPALQKHLLALTEATESDTFLAAAAGLLHAAIPCHVIYTLLHYTAAGGRATTVWGSDGSTFDEDYLRESIATNPTLRILADEPGIKLSRLSDHYPNSAAMEACPWFRKFIAGPGNYHGLVLVFWNESSGFPDLMLGPHRSAALPDFSAEEMQRALALHAHIEAAYRRVRQHQNALAARRSLETFISQLPLSALLLSWDLQPLYQNRAAHDALARWENRSPHERPATVSLPPLLRTEAESMRLEWTRALFTHPATVTFPQRTVPHPTQGGYRALLAMTALRSAHFGQPSFLLRFEDDGTAAPGNLAPLLRLTERERTLALLVGDGLSNQEIAGKLGRSLSTVKSELYAVFRKLEVPSRARLMALLR